MWAVALLLIAGGLYVVMRPSLEKAAQEIALPLRHEDVIRQQAREKGLDAALIAAVIYTETHFVPRESPAGAQGLMQITPETAQFIADRSGGTAFVQEDLDSPQVNISYGSYYLRYLLRRFDGDEVLALAAYNGGEGNVERWLAQAQGEGRELKIADIPFPETRHYVRNVFEARERYREEYPRELGLEYMTDLGTPATGGT